MSAEHPLPVRQEEDRIPGRGVSLTVLAAVVISLALGGWAWGVLRARSTPARWGPPREAPAAVGMVDQTLIGTDTAAYSLADRKRRILESYGWVSEPGGIARIPIERAMQLVAEGYR